MHRLSGILIAALLIAYGPPCSGGTYPDRPIRAIVGVPAGGTADVLARTVTPALSALLGQPIVVDNRGGAGGLVAAEMVARASPDGYTLLLSSSGAMTVLPHLSKSVPYDALKDYAPVSLISTGPFLMIVHPALPAASLKELIALAKAHPGRLDYGSGGNGTANHLGMELFKSMAGVDIHHVPYKGAPQTLTDLVGGRIALTLNSIGSAMPLIKDGRVRALALASPRRSRLLPDVPTASESGLPGFEAGNWLGLFAPARTNRGIVVQLHQATVKALAAAQVSSRLEEQGAIPVGDGPEEFAALIRKEWELNSKLLKQAGVTPD